MSKLNRLIPWVTQPQGIAHPNPSFPTLRSLIHVQPSGKVIDVVKPSRAMSYGANIVTGIYSKGLYVHNQSDGVSEIQATGACQYQTFSRIAIVRRNFDTSAAATISDSATTTAIGGAQWGISAGEMLLNVANTVQIGASAGAGITTGVEHVMGVTYDGSTVKFFIDGRAVGSTLNARTFTIESAATLFSRGGASSPNEDLNGAIGLHADFEGALPESMMRFLTSGSNVFQLYAPRKRQIYIAAAGGIIATLTGQNITVAHGSVSAAITAPLTGQGILIGQGTVAVDPGGVSRAVTGQAANVALGNVSPVVSVALTGQSILLTLGTITPAFERAITGQGVTGSLGNVVAAVAPAISGQSITVSTGNVTASGGAITRALTGQGLFVSLGNIVVPGAVIQEEITYSPQRKVRAPNFAPRKEPAKPEAKKKSKPVAKPEAPRINRLRMANELIMPDSMLDLMQKRREQQAIERQHIYNIRARAALLAA